MAIFSRIKGPNRAKYDPLSMQGFGFPLLVTLGAVATVAATNLAKHFFDPGLATNGRGYVATVASIEVQARGTATGEVWEVKVIDFNGVVKRSLGLVTLDAAGFGQLNVRNSSGNGVGLIPGDGLRADCVTFNASTAASVRVWVEAYGIVC